MPSLNHTVIEQTVEYPSHRFSPEDLLHFVQSTGFSRGWDDAGLSDEDLQAIEIAIMANPKGGNVIKNTGGLRKLRFSPRGWNCGRRGALRVCYVFFEEYKVVLLLSVYRKSERVDLSPHERGMCRKEIESASAALSRGSYS